MLIGGGGAFIAGVLAATLVDGRIPRRAGREVWWSAPPIVLLLVTVGLRDRRGLIDIGSFAVAFLPILVAVCVSAPVIAGRRHRVLVVLAAGYGALGLTAFVLMEALGHGC